jgi:tetratricopeptide (TPR) repeat protein
MVGRLNERRQGAITEQGVRSGTTEVRPQSPTVSAERTRTPDATESVRSRVGLRDRLGDRRAQAVERTERPSVTTSPAIATQQQVAQVESRHRSLGARLAERSRQLAPLPTDPDTPTSGSVGIHRDYTYRRPSYVHARYYDRPDLIRHDYRHLHTYYDHHHRLHHRVIWPHYYYPVYYSFGPRVHFRYVYPYYHRKYVFISLGGWWPSDYSYVRYYWYGYHPYVWYGYYPIAREVAANNYNYYTYNYYSQSDDGSYTSYSSSTPVQNEVRPVDQSTWADVREKLDKQNAEPAAQTLADTRFEEGVKGFEAANYGAAARKFQEAMRLAPNDMILPFAYAQALFADGQYTESADALREALKKVSPDQEGVFYPRGLYANDDVLFAQIESLVDKLERFGYDADMQLLLGYHLLGVGETGYAREPLERASQDMENADSAKVLLGLLEKIESQAKAANGAQDVIVEGSNTESGSDVQTKAEMTPSPDAQTTTGGARLSGAPGSAPAQGAPDAQPQAAPDVGKTQVTPGADEASPLIERRKDNGAAPIMQQSDAGSSGKGPVSLNQAGVALASSPSDLLAGIGRYLRADIAVFAGIVLLGWAGAYVQWRLLGRA